MFALALLWRRGGYLVVRRSRLAWVPHVMWTDDISKVRVWEYKPRHGHKPTFLLGFPISSLFFRGRIRHGKGEENRGADN